MVETLILFVLAGCALGTITGLVPGIHVNTIAIIALELFRAGRFELVALIVSMSIVHSFVDFIPSILLAVPSGDNLMSVLPGHRFFLKGAGHYAVTLTVLGGVVGGVMALVVSPIFLKFLQENISFIGAGVPFVLATILTLMVLDEKDVEKKVFSIGIIIASSLLGIIVLSPTFAIKNPLMALILGFFGMAPLLHSLKDKPVPIKQSTGGEEFGGKMVFENAALSVLAASFVSMFPGIGANQAALAMRTVVGKIKSSDYLVLLGGINTSNMLFSLVALYAVGKTRTGTAAAIKQLIELQAEHMWVLAAVCVIAIAFGAIATIALSKQALKIIGKFDYSKLNLGVLAMLVAIVAFLSNSVGMVAFAIATIIGFSAISFEVKRSHCMAFLITPTIFYYLNILI